LTDLAPASAPGAAGAGSVIEGFTITSHVPSGSAYGIACDGSPVIRANIIVGNSGDGAGGIIGGAPTVVGNVIANNVSDTSGGGVSVVGGVIRGNLICRNRADDWYGGGIHALGGRIEGNVIFGNEKGGIQALGNCVIAHNIIAANDTGIVADNFGISRLNGSDVRVENNLIVFNTVGMLGGDGIVCGSSTHSQAHRMVAINNTIHGNEGPGLRVGGARADVWVVNSILDRNSTTTPSGPEVLLEGATARIEYSVVRGGLARVQLVGPARFTWGTGMLAVDPVLVDPGSADFHLRHDSPCRNAGTVSVPGGVSSIDLDGDPRVALRGQPSVRDVDIGADEFFPHLYHVGQATPGGSIRLRLIGLPGDAGLWGFSKSVLEPPIAVPGLRGSLHLDPASLTVIPLGPFPSSGLLEVPLTFGPGFPRISIPTEALMGVQFSNLHTVIVN
jgi:hypothetical protein